MTRYRHHEVEVYRPIEWIDPQPDLYNRSLGIFRSWSPGLLSCHGFRPDVMESIVAVSRLVDFIPSAWVELDELQVTGISAELEQVSLSDSDQRSIGPVCMRVHVGDGEDRVLAIVKQPGVDRVSFRCLLSFDQPGLHPVKIWAIRDRWGKELLVLWWWPETSSLALKLPDDRELIHVLSLQRRWQELLIEINQSEGELIFQVNGQQASMVNALAGKLWIQELNWGVLSESKEELCLSFAQVMVMPDSLRHLNRSGFFLFPDRSGSHLEEAASWSSHDLLSAETG